MKLGRLAAEYFAWHYSTAFLDLWRIYTNFLWFLYNLFSISFLLATLFDPFERIHADHAQGDLQDFVSAFIANTLMRVVGAVIRLCVIIIGTVLLWATALLGLCIFVLWPLLPCIIGTLFALSFSLLV